MLATMAEAQVVVEDEGQVTVAPESATLKAVAVALSTEAGRMWHHYTTVHTVEPLYALHVSKGDQLVEHTRSQQSDLSQSEAESTTDSVDWYSAEENIILSPSEQEESHIQLSPMDYAGATQGITSSSGERYLAESLIQELQAQQESLQPYEAERSYVEAEALLHAMSLESQVPTIPGSSEESSTIHPELSPNGHPNIGGTEVAKLDKESVCQDSSNDLELLEQIASSPDFLPQQEAESKCDSTQLAALEDRASSLIPVQLVATCDVSTQMELDIFSVHTQTELKQMNEASTNTLIDVQSVSTTTESVLTQDVACNTELSCYELMERVRETELFQKLQDERKAAMSQMNEEKSQRMVAEQLVKIVQSDLSSLRQKSVSETTTRLRLENELGDVKGELAYVKRQAEEKDQRISELEESLTGTSLLVRKLEEQNAVSLMSRGGIDYMVEAKLAEGRAKEAEQKVQVLQTELLQSQNEVRRLLDRVTEASRDKSEMVSSKVHIQLLQIADEKAAAAEQRTYELEKEVRDLREKLSTYLNSKPGATSGTASEKPFISGLFSPSSYSSSYSSPYSTYSSYTPYSSTLSTSYGTLASSMGTKLPGLEAFNAPSSSSTSLTSSMGTKLPGLEAFHAPSSSTTSTSFSSMYSNGSGLTLGSHSTELGMMTSLLESTNEKPSFLSHDTPTSHMTASDSYLSSVKSQPQTDLQPPAVSKKPFPGVTFDFPSIDSTLPVPDTTSLTTGPPAPQPSSTEPGSDDSSDWSSSEEEEEVNGGMPSPLRPSAHAKLTAQWEWRTMQEEGGGGVIDSSLISAPPPKKKPPPIAPKPKALRTLSSDDTITYEPSSSFEDPTRGAALQPLDSNFRRPSGPKGRSLPSRYRKREYLF